MVDGSAPGQVTDMLVGFKTPARVLEIAMKSAPNASADHHIDSHVTHTCREVVASFGLAVQPSNGF